MGAPRRALFKQPQTCVFSFLSVLLFVCVAKHMVHHIC